MPHDDDPDRAAILERRRRWIALALAGAAAAAASGCGTPQPCLSLAPDAGSDAAVAGDADDHD